MSSDPRRITAESDDMDQWPLRRSTSRRPDSCSSQGAIEWAVTPHWPINNRLIDAFCMLSAVSTAARGRNSAQFDPLCICICNTKKNIPHSSLRGSSSSLSPMTRRGLDRIKLEYNPCRPDARCQHRLKLTN